VEPRQQPPGHRRSGRIVAEARRPGKVARMMDESGRAARRLTAARPRKRTPHAGRRTTDSKLDGLRVAILATDGFERSESTGPRQAVDVRLEDASAADFDAR
jgi:hypothetical protein